MSMHATVDTRSPTLPLHSTSATRTLDQLMQTVDEQTVEALLQSFLARRRAVRQARRELAAEQAHREHELLVQRTVLGAGLTHLR